MRHRRSESGELEWSGSCDELRALAASIEDVALARRSSGAVASLDGTDGQLTIVVRRGGDPVRIRELIVERSVELEGGLWLLQIAAWLRAIAARPERRVELSWHRGHYYLASSARPLHLRVADEPGTSLGSD